MDTNDRQIIDGLFDRLRRVDAQAPPRDAEAESLIRQHVERLPAAPYYMAQAIAVQEQALTAAQERIQQLEHELASRPAGGGGLLGGLFGSGARPAEVGPAHRSRLPVTGSAFAQGQAYGRGFGGGGFMAGAMQTALGVAGGMLVASAITSAFGGGAAQAAEPPPLAEEPPVDDAMADVGFEDETW